MIYGVKKQDYKEIYALVKVSFSSQLVRFDEIFMPSNVNHANTQQCVNVGAPEAAAPPPSFSFGNLTCPSEITRWCVYGGFLGSWGTLFFSCSSGKCMKLHRDMTLTLRIRHPTRALLVFVCLCVCTSVLSHGTPLYLSLGTCIQFDDLIFCIYNCNIVLRILFNSSIINFICEIFVCLCVCDTLANVFAV